MKDLSTEQQILMFGSVRTASKNEHEDDADEPEDGFECELDHTESEVENSSHVWQYFMFIIDGEVKIMTRETILWYANINIQLHLTIYLLSINIKNSNTYYHYYR